MFGVGFWEFQRADQIYSSIFGAFATSDVELCRTRVGNKGVRDMFLVEGSFRYCATDEQTRGEQACSEKQEKGNGRARNLGSRAKRDAHRTSCDVARPPISACVCVCRCFGRSIRFLPKRQSGAVGRSLHSPRFWALLANDFSVRRFRTVSCVRY